MKAPMTSKSDLGLFQIPNYRQGVRTLLLAAALRMSTSLVGADTPVGEPGGLCKEVPQDSRLTRVTLLLPDSIHFGKCLDLIELQDGTIIMMVGAPDDDDRGRLWSQGMHQALSSCIAATVPLRSGFLWPTHAPENKPVDFKFVLTHPTARRAVWVVARFGRG